MICLRMLLFFSYSSNLLRNWSPTKSCRSGQESGENKVHCSLFLTRSMNRSGIQRPKNKSRALSSSLPWFFLHFRNSTMSMCQGSNYIANEPSHFPPPWLMYLAVLLNTLIIGSKPVLSPPVPLIVDPDARMLLIDMPTPPDYLLITAAFLTVLYMPSILSLSMGNRKHEDIWHLGVPALNMVGDACVNNFLDIKW